MFSNEERDAMASMAILASKGLDGWPAPTEYQANEYAVFAAMQKSIDGWSAPTEQEANEAAVFAASPQQGPELAQ